MKKLIIVILLIFIVGCTPTTINPEQLCKTEKTVYSCGDLTKAISIVPGESARYYKPNGLQLYCTVVAKTSMNEECKILLETPCTYVCGEVNNFKDCIDAGNPAMESYPRQCMANDKTFIEVIDDDLIVEAIDTPIIVEPNPMALPELDPSLAPGENTESGPVPAILPEPVPNPSLENQII